VARVRTEEKREEIIRIASELFQENGFERTSMSMISDRLGGSKATLYGYFKSKEELLEAVVHHDVPEQSDRLMKAFFEGKDLRESFVMLGTAYLTRLLSPTPVANMRMMTTQPESSGMGKAFYCNVLRPAWGRLAKRIEILMDEGVLHRGDPWLAAMQWKGLHELDLFDKRMFGVTTKGDPAEIKRAAESGADAFLKLYAVEKQKPAKSKKGGKTNGKSAPRS
jgi:AcrR family transcriptional regulator